VSPPPKEISKVVESTPGAKNVADDDKMDVDHDEAKNVVPTVAPSTEGLEPAKKKKKRITPTLLSVNQ
jgi:hypothetical protein